jgi:hypothetical protein
MGSIKAEIHVGKFVMQGGRSYDLRNPFVEALRLGRHALSSFYRNFQPSTLTQMYGLSPTEVALPPWTLPWRDREPPSAECGLGVEHGVSFYGPCTEDKIDLEYRRLTETSESIKREGYRPDLYGHVSGQFLARGQEWRFFVAGGKHRAAAIALLGPLIVPVKVKQGWSMVVRREEADSWPLVINGLVDQTLAEAIFDCYFNE